MNNLQKIVIALLVVTTFAFAKFAFFPGAERQLLIKDNETVEEDVQIEEEQKQDIPKVYADIYFIGQNQNKEEVYKIVKRVYDNETDGTKLEYSIKMLLKGPDLKEHSKGYYSEIPKGTKLLAIDEKAGHAIINLSSEFEQGGGTDSLYKRLYQLIKTANKNTTADVYLYLNGKQANVIGGEGIMINQPLTGKSLDD